MNQKGHYDHSLSKLRHAASEYLGLLRYIVFQAVSRSIYIFSSKKSLLSWLPSFHKSLLTCGVHYRPVQCKKGRAGVQLTVIFMGLKLDIHGLSMQLCILYKELTMYTVQRATGVPAWSPCISENTPRHCPHLSVNER